MKISLVQRVDFIKRACENKSVLHLGCTNHPYTLSSIEKDMLLHSDLQGLARELYGFDFDQEGLDTLREQGFSNLYRADLENLDAVTLEKNFDVIIAGEMIEHLNNPGAFLRGIQRFMREDTKLVITTVNAYCAMRFFIYALRGKGGRNEPVHPDHVAYYSFSTLRLLLSRHGLRVDEFAFYDLGREHRPYNRKIFNLVNDLAVAISPQLADGILAVCTVDSRDDD